MCRLPFGVVVRPEHDVRSSKAGDTAAGTPTNGRISQQSIQSGSNSPMNWRLVLLYCTFICGILSVQCDKQLVFRNWHCTISPE